MKFTQKLKSNAAVTMLEQKNVINAFITISEEKDPEIAVHLRAIFMAPLIKGRHNREALYQKALSDTSIDQNAFLSYYAKIMDISRRVRKITNSYAYESHKEQSTMQPSSSATADSFSYVFKKMHDANVSPDKAQQFFEENCLARFSLTTHPTNPTSLAYTQAGVAFEHVLPYPFEHTQQVDDALRALRDTPITGAKKTTTQEMQEVITLLDVIYASVDDVHAELYQALEPYPQYQQVIDITKPLIEPCTWATGDGDGNDNVDIQALQTGIALLRDRIKAHYVAELDLLIDTANDERVLQRLFLVRNRLITNNYTSPEDMLEDLSPISNIDSLRQKIHTFGLHYAKIDIRHNAEDVMLTLARAALRAGLLTDEKAFLAAPAEEQRYAISEWFKNPHAVAALTSLTPGDMGNDATGKKAGRIFGRLQIIGQNPTMSDKFIIAETKSPANALAALLLLKTTGNKAAEPGAAMDIVTLSESVPDLEALPQLIDDLIEDDIYREHITYRGRIVPMIAKSDTVRRNGMGATSAQEYALGTVYARREAYIARFPELKHIRIDGYNGGGAALQRGGGRVTETAHNARRFATRRNANHMGPVTLTIQGHQMQILFSPKLGATHTLEALAAQNFYARAQIAQTVPVRTAPKGVDERAALKRFDILCHGMRTAYTAYVGDPDEPEKIPGNPAFNELFYNAPWVSIILGNLSSRPAKRGGGTVNGHPSVTDIKGTNPVFLNNRAITVERLAAHSGTHLLTYLGVLEGMHGHSTQELHDMYLGSKSARDFMRNVALALHMTDFSHSWDMMIGEQRPDDEQLFQLAQAFEQRKYSHKPGPNAQNPELQKQYNRELLAWVEYYAMDVAACVHRCVTGKEPASNLTLQTPLRTSWPDLAGQLAIREAEVEFARSAEAKITQWCNNNPHAPLTPEMIERIQAIYAAADVVNAPEAMMTALTRGTEQGRPMTLAEHVLASKSHGLMAKL